MSGEVRRAINGRESEFVAIGFIVLGVIVGLAVYARLAGPVGRGADTALGCLLGLGRYCLPLVFVAIGVAQLRGDEAPNRVKLALGLGFVFVLSAAITVVFAYRLEIARLTVVYQEYLEDLQQVHQLQC